MSLTVLTCFTDFGQTQSASRAWPARIRTSDHATCERVGCEEHGQLEQHVAAVWRQAQPAFFRLLGQGNPRLSVCGAIFLQIVNAVSRASL
jgi:hypothetical protein